MKFTHVWIILLACWASGIALSLSRGFPLTGASVWLVATLSISMAFVRPNFARFWLFLCSFSLLICSGLLLYQRAPNDVLGPMIMFLFGLGVLLRIVSLTRVISHGRPLGASLFIATFPLAIFVVWTLVQMRASIAIGNISSGLGTPVGVVLLVLIFCTWVSLYALLRSPAPSIRRVCGVRMVFLFAFFYLALAFGFQFAFPINLGIFLAAVILVTSFAIFAYVALPEQRSEHLARGSGMPESIPSRVQDPLGRAE
jgi:hypothetical protein